MSKVLCTFSGKIGDIMWSLPTVRAISQMYSEPVAMGIMPQYKNLLSLLQGNSYIANAFTIDDWQCTGSPWGDQPWEAPVHGTYDKVHHLAYRRHPVRNEPLIDMIAAQQGIILEEPVCPFIDTMDLPSYKETYIAYAFNELYADLKGRFLTTLRSSTGIRFIDVTKLEWLQAKYVIKYAACFVGCRSSNHVLAHGVGQKNIVIYEPHPARNGHGQFGTTFTNPHLSEIENDLYTTPEIEAGRATYYIKQWIEEKQKENLDEAYQTTPR